MSPVKVADVAFGVSASFATGSVLAAWLEIAAKGFAIIASLIAIVAGVYAIRVHRKNLKK